MTPNQIANRIKQEYIFAGFSFNRKRRHRCYFRNRDISFTIDTDSQNMKSCPTCHRFFNNTVDFCVDDGTALVVDPAASGYMPTQVVTPVQLTGSHGGGSGRLVYVALGAMGAVILVLGFVLYFVLGVKEAPATQAAVSKSPVSPPTANTLTTALLENDKKSFELTTRADLPPITEIVARALITEWEMAQDTQNFAPYRACYSSNFLGIKRTTDSKTQMKYAAWMMDRRKMMPNVVEVQVDSPLYTLDGDTMVVKFIQKWRSVRVCDIGPKTMRIKMTENGPRIVYEELEYSNPCS